ncbi:DUF6153 family protein [Streptomyces sp. NPDC052682]|uniref:DUF6153 family protein n=1 Tax=Streptomyces sp. NPDC052682 TaxID=3154954 RepID=UPI00343F1DE5
MSPVHSPEQRDPRPPVRWWRAVCVLGLLAGLLAMHGLAPGGAAPGHSHAGPSTAVAAGTHEALGAAVVALSVDGECPDGPCGGGHAQHADPTCASAAVSGGPVLPALVVDPVPVPVRTETLRTYAAAARDGGRAPPDLAELQLLRI